jgi:hypothetical protein
MSTGQQGAAPVRPVRQVQHFRRAREMEAKIVAASELKHTAEADEALAAIGPYISRGHGEGLVGNKHSGRRVAMDKRDAVKRRNRLRNKEAHA